MKRLKNIIIIFICFLMLCSFTNDETAPLEYVQSFENIRNVSGSFSSAFDPSYDSRNYVDTFNNQANENQKTLNICWAFASNNVLEAYMSKVKGLTHDYSENQPEYVARYLGDISGFGDANNTFNVVKYMFYNITPVSEFVFDPNGYFTTYKDKELKSYMSSNVGLDIQKVKLFNQYPVKELLNGNYTESQIYDNIASYNEKIKEYIKNYGAVMSIIHTDFLTKTYDGSYGWCYNNGAKDESEYKNSAHAVALIGWDDNYVWQGSNKAPYKGAWLAANSWGTSTTFFYISYFDVSVVKGALGVSSINNNALSTQYTNSYLVGESAKFAKSYKDNREKYYTRTNTSTTTETFKYYIGEDTEKLSSVKILFFGFSNSNSVVSNLRIKVEVIGPDDNTFNTTTVDPGITGLSLRNINLSGTITINVSITNPTNLNIANMYYAVALYTKNSNTTSKIYINSKESNYINLANSNSTFDIVTKNIDPATAGNVTVKVLDANSSDITSKFTISKKDLVFDSTRVNLLQKENLSTNKITLRVTAGGVTSSKTYNATSPSYSFNNYAVDETNKIVRNISPKTTVSAFLSNVTGGGTKTVYDKNNNALSNTSNVTSGCILKIVVNGNTYTYTLSVMGDVTSDGNINISDVMKVATHSIKGGKLTTQLEIYSADVTKDGKINISDVMKIANYSIKGVGL